MNKSAGAARSFASSELAHPSNLQKIKQRKAQVKNYSKSKKQEKIALYSSCKVSMFFCKIFIP